MPRGLLLLTTLSLGLFGCAPAASPHGWGDGSPVSVNRADPFAPASMRIFPLTRLDRDAAGKPMIVCHVEFRDPWGDSVKAVGRLRITMAGAITPPGSARQDLPPLTWDIDLADLANNAKLYDRATRTYRIQLVDLPPILATVAAPPADAAAPASRILLNATFAPTTDGPSTLQDDYTLQS